MAAFFQRTTHAHIPNHPDVHIALPDVVCFSTHLKYSPIMTKDKASPKKQKQHIPPLRFSTLLKVLMELDDVPQPPPSATGACADAKAELEKEPGTEVAKTIPEPVTHMPSALVQPQVPQATICSTGINSRVLALMQCWQNR